MDQLQQSSLLHCGVRIHVEIIQIKLSLIFKINYINLLDDITSNL